MFLSWDFAQTNWKFGFVLHRLELFERGDLSFYLVTKIYG